MARIIPNQEARLNYKQRLFLGFVLKPLRLFCESCDTCVPSNMVWCCAYCGAENTKTRLYSFLNKCEHCKRSPKSYACPQCASINYLDEDSDGTMPARSTAKPSEIPTQTVEEELSPEEMKHREHEEKKADIAREMELLGLNAKLVQMKESLAAPKTARERLERSFEEHEAHAMAIHAIAKEQRDKNAERYKDDPEMLEMANESLNNWVESQL
jgi:hypothetical protein